MADRFGRAIKIGSVVVGRTGEAARNIGRGIRTISRETSKVVRTSGRQISRAPPRSSPISEGLFRSARGEPFRAKVKAIRKKRKKLKRRLKTIIVKIKQ